MKSALKTSSQDDLHFMHKHCASKKSSVVRTGSTYNGLNNHGTTIFFRTGTFFRIVSYHLFRKSHIFENSRFEENISMLLADNF